MEQETTPGELPKRIPQVVPAPETMPLIASVNVPDTGGTARTYHHIPLTEVASALADARQRYLTTGKLTQADLDMVEAAASYVSLSASLSPDTTIGLPVVPATAPAPSAQQRAVVYGKNPVVEVWFLAQCEECAGPAIPFRNYADRDEWTARHVAAVDHTVATPLEVRW